MCGWINVKQVFLGIVNVPRQGAAISLPASSWGHRRQCEVPAPWSGTPSRMLADRWTTSRSSDGAGTWTTAGGQRSTSWLSFGLTWSPVERKKWGWGKEIPWCTSKDSKASGWKLVFLQSYKFSYYCKRKKTDYLLLFFMDCLQQFCMNAKSNSFCSHLFRE